MKISKAIKIGVTILVVLLIGAVGVLGSQLANAKRNESIANANIRALNDTVRVYQTKVTDAANLFQFQAEIDSDSIAKLNTALGAATRDLELEHVAITEAIVQIRKTQASLDSALVELTNVTNPEGRPERIAAFQLDTTFVQADIVVVVPADTSLGIEVEVVFFPKPFKITTSLACTPDHDAVATFETPPGILATPEMGTVDPRMCHPKSSFFSMNLNLGSFVYGGIGFGAGYLVGNQLASPSVDVNVQTQRNGFSFLTIRF